ncbi:MAG: T9SS type A sorting domain-containing protein [Candidatus Pacebacteria bacterium]|nr:T9SS type A sorting domain-containing protein [Candidatus Paceibacterota bacterium]
MKKIILLLSFFFIFLSIQSQNWMQVPGYQTSYGSVSGITKYQGELWVKTANAIYKVSGSSWQITTTGFTVTNGSGCLYTDGTDLYAGGLFIFGTYQALVLKWNGTSWDPIAFTNNLASGVHVSTILKTQNYLHVGGFFTSIGNSPSNINLSMQHWASLDNGSWVQLFSMVVPGCASAVWDIKKIGDSIYVAGGFSEIGGMWTPGTFRFKEGGGMSILDGYIFCNIATSYSILGGELYAGGTRKHDLVNINVGLAKRVSNTWNAVSDQMEITNSRITKLVDRIFIGGKPGNVNGVTTNMCSYNGSIFTNEGIGISSPTSLNVYPEVYLLFADTVLGTIYVSGSFKQQDGNVADNFAVRAIYPLPVHLSSFNAKVLADKSIKLDWRDETPENGVEFDVQVSNNGRDFRSIGKITEKGDKKDYSFIYPNKDCGKLFFRLAFEGKYSEIRTVDIPCDISIIAYQKSLRIQTQNPGTLTILNTSSQLLARTVLANGYCQIPLDLPSGVYIAKFVDKNGNIFSQKFLIQ